MALAQDPITALVTHLKADSTISSLLGTRVFGLELPNSEVASMPRQAIVIKSAGGIGEDSYIDVFSYRLDFICYGETPFKANEAFLTLRTVLRALEPVTVSSTRLYNAIHSAGPFFSRDSDTDWPMQIDTWMVKVEDTIVS